MFILSVHIKLSGGRDFGCGTGETPTEETTGTKRASWEHVLCES